MLLGLLMLWRIDSACGSFAGVSFKFSWRDRVAVVAALDADWEDTMQWFL